MGIVLICFGASAIWARRGLSEASNQANRWNGNMFGEIGPRTVVIWGIGIIIVGLLTLL